jgi:site-specific DNA recombinase
MIALYARVSTDAQAEKYALSSQLYELRKYAAGRYPHEPVIELADEVSGATLDRPKLDELRRLVRSDTVSIIVAYDPDRLSRELVDLLLLTKEFEKHQVLLDFVAGGFEQTPSGRMLLQMRGVIAEYERTQIRARTLRGKLEAARQGRMYGERHPFGYDREGGALKVNEQQAEVVRRMFAMVLNDESVREIAAKLTADGALPQRGQQWRTSSIHRILRNRCYIGETAYNRRKKVGKHQTVFRPQNEWIALAVPSIVSREIFDRAQSQLKRNGELLSGRNDKRFYLLRGLLRCASCGNRLAGCASHGRPFYRCGGHDRLQLKVGRCRAASLPADKLEAFVIMAVRTVLKGGLLRRKVEEHAVKLQAVDFDVELTKAQREIEKWRRTEERAARFLVSPEHAGRQSLFEKSLNEATQQRLAEEQRKVALEQAKAAQESVTNREDAMRLAGRQGLRALAKLNLEQWRRVLQLLLDEISVDGRSLEFRGIIPSDSTALFRSEGEHVVAARRRYFERPLRAGLAADIAKIGERFFRGIRFSGAS